MESKKEKKIVPKWLMLTIGVILFFLIFLFYVDISEVFEIIFTIKIEYFLLYIGFSLLSFYCYTYRSYLALSAKKKFTLKEYLPPFSMSYSLSMFTPMKVGELSLMELNKKFDIEPGETLAAIIFYRIIDIFVLLVLFLTGINYILPLLELNSDIQSFLQILNFLLILLFPIVLILLIYPPIGRLMVKIVNKIGRRFLSTRWDRIENFLDIQLQNYYSFLITIKSMPIRILKILFVVALRWILEFIALWFLYIALGANDVSLILVSTSLAFNYIIGLISFIPGGIGSGDMAAIFLLEIVADKKEIAAAVSLVARAYIGILMIVMTLFALWHYSSKEKEIEIKN